MACYAHINFRRRWKEVIKEQAKCFSVKRRGARLGEFQQRDLHARPARCDRCAMPCLAPGSAITHARAHVRHPATHGHQTLPCTTRAMSPRCHYRAATLPRCHAAALPQCVLHVDVSLAHTSCHTRVDTHICTRPQRAHAHPHCHAASLSLCHAI